MTGVWTNDDLNRLCDDAMDGKRGESGELMGKMLFILKAFLSLQEKLLRDGGVSFTPSQIATLPELIDHTRDCVRMLADALSSHDADRIADFADAYVRHVKADNLRDKSRQS